MLAAAFVSVEPRSLSIFNSVPVYRNITPITSEIVATSSPASPECRITNVPLATEWP